MKLLFLLLALLMLCGCGGTQKYTDTVFAMDTVMTLTVYAAPGSQPETLLRDSKEEIHRLEALLSVTDPDSEIAHLAGGRQSLSPETHALLSQALRCAAMTEGAFDPTLYTLVDLWGFYDDDYSVPDEDALQEARSHTGYTGVSITDNTVSLPEGMGIDLGGIAKGYTARQVLEILRDGGIRSAIISLGGNVGILGKKPDGSPWQVAIQSPDAPGQAMAVLSLPGGNPQFVVTSGAYQRFFEADGIRYHHILDPATGTPADSDLTSVTILSEDGTLADALSTALFVMGREQAVAFWQANSDAFDMVLFDGETLWITPEVSIDTELPTVEVTP